MSYDEMVCALAPQCVMPVVASQACTELDKVAAVLTDPKFHKPVKKYGRRKANMMKWKKQLNRNRATTWPLLRVKGATPDAGLHRFRRGCGILQAACEGFSIRAELDRES